MTQWSKVLGRRDWRVWAMVALAVIALACEGDTGTAGPDGRPKQSQKSETPRAVLLPRGLCTVHVSRPYVSVRPQRSGMGLFRFAVKGEADVVCTERVHAIEMVAVLHYRTDGRAGAFKGRSYQCGTTDICHAEVEYWRDGLHCGEFYSYEDYVQIIGSYRQTATSTLERIDVEGRIGTGSAHFPPDACGKE
jgi:hypothetical protein